MESLKKVVIKTLDDIPKADLSRTVHGSRIDKKVYIRRVLFLMSDHEEFQDMEEKCRRSGLLSSMSSS